MMRVSVESVLVDAIITDGWVGHPEKLTEALRNPAGRQPSSTSLAVAATLSGLDDHDANILVRAIADAVTFSLLSLIDADFKKSGLHARFDYQELTINTEDGLSCLVDAYRSRVAPNGVVGVVE